jgi:hypothetical protein
MKFHIDLARYRAILAKQGCAFPNAMRMMEPARIVYGAGSNRNEQRLEFIRR